MQPAEGEDLAKANHAAWVETSAKNNFNVCELPSLSTPNVAYRELTYTRSQSLRNVSRRDRATNPDQGRTAAQPLPNYVTNPPSPSFPRTG